MAHGPLIILSGPSGSGKSTLTALVVIRSTRPLHVSISATTRKPRPNEIDGVHYHFWTEEKFFAAEKEGAFLEWAQVHGQYYGTLVTEVENYVKRGIGVILDIDVQGARSVRKRYSDAVTVFVKASSWDAYEERIRRRGAEDDAAIERRLETARRELTFAGEFQWLIINDDLEAATAQLLGIVERSFSEESHSCSKN